jgi:transposase
MPDQDDERVGGTRVSNPLDDVGSSKRYRARRGDRNEKLRTRCGICQRSGRDSDTGGYKRVWEREGIRANHKRVYRIYGQEGLTLRKRGRKKWMRTGEAVAEAAHRANPVVDGLCQ